MASQRHPRLQRPQVEMPARKAQPVVEQRQAEQRQPLPETESLQPGEEHRRIGQDCQPQIAEHGQGGDQRGLPQPAFQRLGPGRGRWGGVGHRRGQSPAGGTAVNRMPGLVSGRSAEESLTRGPPGGQAAGLVVGSYGWALLWIRVTRMEGGEAVLSVIMIAAGDDDQILAIDPIDEAVRVVDAARPET